MKRWIAAIATCLAVFVWAPASAAPLPSLRIVTPAYTLECLPHLQGKTLELACVPAKTPAPVADALERWRYGDPAPRGIFAQTYLNGGPVLCADTTLVCTTGAVGINPAGAPTVANLTDSGLTASDLCVAANASKQLVDGPCLTTAGGQTVTAAETFSGGATFGGLLTNTAQIQALGAGGANSCAGTNYPAANYGLCLGANNGTGNFIGLVIGPQATTFACTATCTVSDSARIAFFDANASGAGGRECDFWKLQASATLESGCGLIAAGSAGVQTSILRNQVTNDWNGTCASVATGPHCVTAVRSGQTETGLTCFQLDVTNHAFAVDTGVTLSNSAAYTFTSTIPNGFVGSTSTASATTDTVTWWCFKP